MKKSNIAFSMLEAVLVVAAIVILAGIVILAVKPAQELTERQEANQGAEQEANRTGDNIILEADNKNSIADNKNSIADDENSIADDENSIKENSNEVNTDESSFDEFLINTERENLIEENIVE